MFEQQELVHLKEKCNCASAYFFNCMDSTTNTVGWEGSAILRHGSVIAIGCYTFVLGLVDHAMFGEEDINRSKTTIQIPISNLTAASGASLEAS